MKRWAYAIRIYGIVEENPDEIVTETLDDVRGLILHSFKEDLEYGVKIESHSITVSELQSND